jgi:hypothetical protein
MKCREFQNAVADYVGGRLDVQQAQTMDDHKAICFACAQSCAQERGLRQSFQAAPIPAPIPDVWPQVAAQLQASSAVPGRPFAYRRVWSGALCGVGACTAFLCIGLLSRPAPSADSDLTQPISAVAANRPFANDTIIGLVSDMRDGPDTETEANWAEDASDHQEKRSLLLGEQN